jgi:hypothetical protein
MRETLIVAGRQIGTLRASVDEPLKSFLSVSSAGTHALRRPSISKPMAALRTFAIRGRLVKQLVSSTGIAGCARASIWMLVQVPWE